MTRPTGQNENRYVPQHPLANLAPRPLSSNCHDEFEALQLFRDTGALLDGHLFRSGLHSRQYFQCALAPQQMPIVERFGCLGRPSAFARAVTVIAPPWWSCHWPGGRAPTWLALHFRRRKRATGATPRFKIAPGEKMIVVEDVVTKGGRVQETIYRPRERRQCPRGRTMVDRSMARSAWVLRVQSAEDEC